MRKEKKINKKSSFYLGCWELSEKYDAVLMISSKLMLCNGLYFTPKMLASMCDVRKTQWFIADVFFFSICLNGENAWILCEIFGHVIMLEQVNKNIYLFVRLFLDQCLKHACWISIYLPWFFFIPFCFICTFQRK